MQDIEKRAQALQQHIKEVYQRLDIDAKNAELTATEEALSDSGVWSNVERAQQLSKTAARLHAEIEPWQTLQAQAADIIELMQLGDDDLRQEFEQQLAAMELTHEELKKTLLYTGKYDTGGAVLKLSAGAGGTDAQDWTEMLERMYVRWAEKSDLKMTLIERSTGEEAGIKSALYEVSGLHAYGKLRSENGVHRLVRISPFNSDNLRQTSFALVEIMPDIETPSEVALEEKDLKIDVYRAGGHGGQSVNTTDSAVRVTHIPTGTVVAIQNERSQIQNKETALRILRSKIAQMQLEQHAKTIADLRAGESASWGAQIRNYVLHPYTMVKDTRTKHEDRDAQGVLDGKLDEFMVKYLESAEH